MGNFSAYHTKCKMDDLSELLRDSEKLKKALKQIRLSGGLFVDQEFDPDHESLVGHSRDRRKINEMRKLTFERSSVYFDSKARICDTMESADILQGNLGNCYFLAAISAIAEKPERLERLFLSDAKASDGIYAVAMCIDGIWEEIVMDDFAPCDQSGQLVFNKSRTNEMWVILLEKAWAKVHGGYLNIESGLSSEALRDLTGASVKTYFLQQGPADSADLEQIWTKLMHAERSHFIMTAGSKNLSNGSDAYVRSVGICGSHAYSLLAVYQLDRRSRTARLTGPGEEFTDRLVKLRNPWGSREWKGKWADDDPDWTPQLSRLVRSTGKRNDGVFFMGWDDFVEYYTDVQVCHFHDGYKYSAEQFGTAHNQTVYLRFRLDAPGRYYFGVNQRKRRFFPAKSKYVYSRIDWLLGGSREGRVEFVCGGRSRQKENWADAECAAGEYWTAIHSHWLSSVREFSFSVYGPGLTDLERVDEADLPEGFMQSLFESVGRQEMPTEGCDFGHNNYPGLKYMMKDKNGWGYLYAQNDETGIAAKMKLGFGDNGSPVELLCPREASQPSMTLEPGQSGVIVCRNHGADPLRLTMSALPETRHNRGGHSRAHAAKRDLRSLDSVEYKERQRAPQILNLLMSANCGAPSEDEPVLDDRISHLESDFSDAESERTSTSGSSTSDSHTERETEKTTKKQLDYRFKTASSNDLSISRPSGFSYTKDDLSLAIAPRTTRRRVVKPRQLSEGGHRLMRVDRHERQRSFAVPMPSKLSILERARNSISYVSKAYKGRLVDIKMKFLFHDDGVAILYLNFTSNLVLSEEVRFDLANARVKGVAGDKLRVELGPGEELLVEAVRESAGVFNARVSRISYEIRELSLFRSQHLG